MDSSGASETELKQLQTDVNALRVEKNNLSLLKQPYKDLLVKVEKLEQEKVQLETNYQQQNNLLEQAKAVYESKKTSIPASYSKFAGAPHSIDDCEKTKRSIRTRLGRSAK